MGKCYKMVIATLLCPPVESAINKQGGGGGGSIEYL